jgi:hypothetical protein
MPPPPFASPRSSVCVCAPRIVCAALSSPPHAPGACGLERATVVVFSDLPSCSLCTHDPVRVRSLLPCHPTFPPCAPGRGKAWCLLPSPAGHAPRCVQHREGIQPLPHPPNPTLPAANGTDSLLYAHQCVWYARSSVRLPVHFGVCGRGEFARSCFCLLSCAQARVFTGGYAHPSMLPGFRVPRGRYAPPSFCLSMLLGASCLGSVCAVLRSSRPSCGVCAHEPWRLHSLFLSPPRAAPCARFGVGGGYAGSPPPVLPAVHGPRGLCATLPSPSPMLPHRARGPRNARCLLPSPSPTPRFPDVHGRDRVGVVSVAGLHLPVCRGMCERVRAAGIACVVLPYPPMLPGMCAWRGYVPPHRRLVMLPCACGLGRVRKDPPPPGCLY